MQNITVATSAPRLHRRLTFCMPQELEKGMQEMMASYSVEEESAEAAQPEPAKQASKKAAGGSKRARTQPKGEP